MSTLIQTLVAFGIVRECCYDNSPTASIVKELSGIIEAITAALPAEPLESGVGLSPGPTAPRVIPTRGPGTMPLPVPVPTAPAFVVLKPYSVGDLVSALTKLKQIKDTLSTKFDFCTPLLGCVAEGFRKAQLDQKDGWKRKRLVDRGFVQHYLDVTHFPKRVQHTSRRK
jgi:hypothetical protein